MKYLKRFSFTIILFIFLIASFQFQACKHDPVGVDKLDSVCFETQVLPIFVGSCGLSGCHSAADHKAEFDATSYASIYKNISPGKPGSSNLYSVVSEPNNPNFMPPSGHSALTIQQLTFLEVWILQGAKETQCATVQQPSSPLNAASLQTYKNLNN